VPLSGADRHLIRTLPGRGYQLIAEIDTIYGSPEVDAATALAAVDPRASAPVPIADMDRLRFWDDQ